MYIYTYMLCLRTNLQLNDVTGELPSLARELSEKIPAGVGEEGEIRLAPDALDEVLTGGAQWAVEHGYGAAADLQFIEEGGRVGGPVPENVSPLAKKRQRGEMGTLGSGNHYLEVQVVDRLYDAPAARA